jgi:hypothetical protein
MELLDLHKVIKINAIYNYIKYLICEFKYLIFELKEINFLFWKFMNL